MDARAAACASTSFREGGGERDDFLIEPAAALMVAGDVGRRSGA